MTESTVFGGPTKRFFVSMLTRDIELIDAILDLIDNCVDGAMRQEAANLDAENVFDGYRAKLTLTADLFEISDNCGGIPGDFIENAFSLGRPNIEQDGDLPTIGMYGIGMKRAIFKMANSAVVSSNHEELFAEVSYSSEWLNPQNDDWMLPISREACQDNLRGVSIRSDDLKPDIANIYADPAFANNLGSQISGCIPLPYVVSSAI